MSEVPHPEGIEHRHIERPARARLHDLPVGLIGLGILMVASALGMFGREVTVGEAGKGTTLEVHAPARIRNGEFFEMLITVEADRSVSDLVVSIDEDVWRDVTVNTLIPAATEETFTDGGWSFSFGPIGAGQRLVVKVDCQINPDHAPGANRGRISIADGDAELASIDHSMEVLP